MEKCANKKHLLINQLISVNEHMMEFLIITVTKIVAIRLIIVKQYDCHYC